MAVSEKEKKRSLPPSDVLIRDPDFPWKLFLAYMVYMNTALWSTLDENPRFESWLERFYEVRRDIQRGDTKVGNSEMVGLANILDEDPNLGELAESNQQAISMITSMSSTPNEN